MRGRLRSNVKRAVRFFIVGEESRRLRRNATVQETVGEFNRRRGERRRPGPR